MIESMILYRDGFANGYSPITQIEGAEDPVQMNFGILKMKSGERFKNTSDLECTYLLMNGKATFTLEGERYPMERHSIFDEDPYTCNFSKDIPAEIEAFTDCEWVVCQVANEVDFGVRYFPPEKMWESEHRGKGLLEDTAYRIVRTVFDKRNHQESNMVIGEVITFPGRWSSYPPHHHPQPELYHYRFTEPQGYGHAELGDIVFKVQENDTIKITDLHDHSQVAAPGYGMYYLWAIRHLPDNPYTVPEFTEAHQWMMKDDSNVWKPKQRIET